METPSTTFIFMDSNWHYQWCNIDLIFSQIEIFMGRDKSVKTMQILPCKLSSYTVVDFWRQSYEQRNWMDSECTSMPVVYGVSKYLDRHHRLSFCQSWLLHNLHSLCGWACYVHTYTQCALKDPLIDTSRNGRLKHGTDRTQCGVVIHAGTECIVRHHVKSIIVIRLV